MTTPPTHAPHPGAPAYPATLEIDYPDRPLDRLSTLLRLLYVIPIGVVLAVVSGGGSSTYADDGTVQTTVISAGGILIAGPLLMILFRQKYPRWWFDWNLELTRFSARVSAYVALLSDRYPSTDEAQGVHLEVPYPEVHADLNRWMPLVKWFLAIPHFVVLAFLGVGAVFAVIFAWFAILFTGRYPRGLFDYVVGVGRWSLRVSAYAVLLATDEYPPFRLSP